MQCGRPGRTAVNADFGRGGESPVNTQNRAVYSFAAQTSPIPAAIERRYVGVGNRSQPLGRDRSAHLLGHRRAILAGGVAERGVEWGGSSQASVSAASAASAR